jgi:hypothetical protein
VIQHITPEMLQELTDEQKERLREWWEPKDGDLVQSVKYPDGRSLLLGAILDEKTKDKYLPLLSIGQCIELLGEKRKEISIGYNDSGCFWHIHIGPRGTGNMLDGFGERYADPDTGELIIPLWRAIKAVL